MISNDNELMEAVEIVDEYLQQIQDYLGQGPRDVGRIRFLMKNRAGINY